MKFKIWIPALLLAATLGAHHSTSAVFDMQKPVTVKGTLTKVDWINPHIVMLIDAKGEGGKLEHWTFESNPPAWYRRVGISRADLAKGIGQEVTFGGVRAKDGSLYGYVLSIAFADGTKFEIKNPDKDK